MRWLSIPSHALIDTTTSNDSEHRTNYWQAPIATYVVTGHMNKKILLVAIGLWSLPMLAFGCSTVGDTIVYINGIETTKEAADDAAALLSKLIPSVHVITGYNPSHLDGIGDEIESISQAFNVPISDLDLDTILAQIAPEILTQKLLLVGHSQGSFYTNELYDELVASGIPTSSLAVYDIATPAQSVAGGGRYLTSSNDKVINLVRKIFAALHVSPVLPANIDIPEEYGYDADTWGGHSLAVYISGASERIVSDIKQELATLTTDQNRRGPCVAAPSQGLSLAAQRFIFGMTDPAVSGLDESMTEARNTIASVISNANDILHAAFSDVLFSIIPKPTAQNAAGAFAVEKALYGSSLSVDDYEALLNGEDVPEVRPMPTASVPKAQSAPVSPPAPYVAPSEPIAVHLSTTTSSTPIAIPTPTPISTSPGYGGGSSAPPVQNAAPPDSSVSVPVPQATTTDRSTATTTSQTDQENATSTASTTIDVVSSTSTASASLASAPVTDTFDAGFSGWQNFPLGWSIASWATDTASCYSGNCLVETAFNQQYEQIKNGTALNSGAFVIYFRNKQYLGQFGVGVCTDATSSQCETPTSVGGTRALIYTILNNYIDNSWHYLYFAFRDGVANKEYCGMVDSSDTSMCGWQPSSVPNGTTYSGVLFFTENGLNFNASFYWDELGLEPHAPG